MSIEDIEKTAGGEAAFLEGLHQELRTKSYQPQAVKRVYIEKPDGRKRPLGIPTVRDRVVQAACLLILELIFEADFEECSYGFRPEKRAPGIGRDPLAVRTGVSSGVRRGLARVL